MKSKQSPESVLADLAQIERHYWNLRSLNAALNRAKPRQHDPARSPADTLLGAKRGVLKQVQDYINSRHAVDFQYNTLGVIWGAYGLANNILDQFLVVLPNILYSQPSFPVIDIPWGISVEANNRFEEFIDYLCDQQRQIQLLSDPSAFAPELYWNLPPRSHFPLSLVHLQNKLTNASFDFLYCPIGEVTFFLLVWRLLFRSSQKNGKDARFKPGEVALAEGIGTARDWGEVYPSFWENLEFDDEKESKEQSWLSSVSHLQEGVRRGASSKLPDDLREKISVQWHHWRMVLDDHPGNLHPYVSDWVRLGLLPLPEDALIPDGKVLVSETLLATIRYGIHASVSIGVDQAVQKKLTALLSSLNLASGSQDSVSTSVLLDVDDVLQTVIWEFLRTLADNVCIKTHMEKLHGIARFPLLNFFYTNAVCGCQAVQLVIPVWRSHAFPVRLQVPDDQDNRVEELSSAVGVALLAAKPIPELDWTMSDTKLADSANSVRMFGIATYFEQIAQPIIDQGLYGELVSLMLQREASQREWAMINASIGHALKEPFPYLQKVIEQGRKQIEMKVISTIDQLKKTFDDLESTLSPASGIASMSHFLIEAQKPNNRTYAYGFQSVEKASPKFLCLSTEYVQRRLAAAIDYIRKIKRSGWEPRICDSLDARGFSNLIAWQAVPTLELKQLFSTNSIVNADDPPAGACNSVLTELLVNAIRYNSSSAPGLLIIVASTPESDLKFVVLNQLADPALRIDSFENTTRDQRAYVGLSLVKYCLQALKWGPEIFFGPLNPRDERHVQILEWTGRSPSELKDRFGIDLNSTFQAIGFTCPIVIEG